MFTFYLVYSTKSFCVSWYTQSHGRSKFKISCESRNCETRNHVQALRISQNKKVLLAGQQHRLLALIKNEKGNRKQKTIEKYNCQIQLPNTKLNDRQFLKHVNILSCNCNH